MAQDETAADLAGVSFEKALAELESIVGKLEQGNVPLEESIALYERGAALKRHCDRLLEAAEQRVEKITAAGDGRPVGTEPLDRE
ncbi:MAG TPA: exodeoxyribonuclease VII small subunit [Hyphomicrobiales bacterium]|nr:exodeoxyribonuclease VII small subunit [Hyphomicrobiales bacterium]